VAAGVEAGERRVVAEHLEAVVEPLRQLPEVVSEAPLGVGELLVGPLGAHSEVPRVEGSVELQEELSVVQPGELSEVPVRLEVVVVSEEL